MTVTLATSALAAADDADRSAGTEALHGVPFTIKENIDIVGSATTQGVPAMAGAMPPVDAPIVARMKAAGAIPLARTNLPEFAMVAALVTSIPGAAMPPAFADAVRSAGSALESAGWKVEEVTPPELELVNEVWIGFMAFGLRATAPLIMSLMTPGAAGIIEQLLAFPSMDPDALFVERHRLRREWSAFLVDHPVIVGPTWTDVQFEHDADIDPDTGVATTLDRLLFITPGNLLGIPSCAVPTGVSGGLPTGVQVYADLWRDDRCLDAAEIIEGALGTIAPIDPR